MRTLLLADDSITIQRVIALTFAEEAFRVITVSDGQQAIDRMIEQRPDVVLAATTMPNVSGYDVSRYVRSQPGLKDIPVLLLTGAFESVDEERLKASGANGTLEKPFEPTIVISRVKELLGIKTDAKPTPATGRTVTPADSAAKRPPRPQAVTSKPPVARAAATPTPAPVKPSPASWDELREEGGLEAGTRSVEGIGHEPGREDYLDTLDAAFDTLDARLSKRPGSETAAPRNPDPPVRRAEASVDPRSPGRLPTPKSDGAPGNAVFEVDDQWFAEGDQARAATNVEQRQLAAEMGIHDVELPEPVGAVNEAPAHDLDFDFGLEGVRPNEAAINVHDEMASVVAAPHVDPSPVEIPSFEDLRDAAPAVESPTEAASGLASLAPMAPVAPYVAPLPAAPHVPVADSFEAMLAHEQGEPHAMPVPEPPAPMVVQAPAPEITDAMLDVIADKVAERLNGNLFGDHLRAAMAATLRDTVRSVVSETSEKLVRDEIARVKAQAERDTQ